MHSFASSSPSSTSVSIRIEIRICLYFSVSHRVHAYRGGGYFSERMAARHNSTYFSVDITLEHITTHKHARTHARIIFIHIKTKCRRVFAITFVKCSFYLLFCVVHQLCRIRMNIHHFFVTHAQSTLFLFFAYICVSSWLWVFVFFYFCFFHLFCSVFYSRSISPILFFSLSLSLLSNTRYLLLLLLSLLIHI